tara:strand:+ start:367 stop:1494 length:1128 start_codon:yes stop_codon:yes gene_type:complete
MAYTDIDDPSVHFQTTLYTGAGAGQTVTNGGNSDLKPDFLWIKRRNAAYGHVLVDSSRGLGSSNPPYLASEASDAENSNQNWISGVGTDGFTIGINEQNLSNTSGTYVAWQWKANGGTTATNTTGNGIDSVVQANTTAGFSIVTYTGNGTQSGQTVGHGLGAVPTMIISKDRNASSNVPNWRVYTVGMGNTKYLTLDTDAAASVFNDWDDTTPTSSVYSVGGAGGYTPTNNNNTPYVAYVFADVQGYSKFGSYVGNGSGTSDGTFNGPFVYLGFKPAWVLIKRASYSAGDGWTLFDNTRPPRGGSTTGNYNQNKLNPASTAAESGALYDAVDFLSNGFKARTGRAGVNASGSTYIYAAFAENPFVTSTGVPTTAR